MRKFICTFLATILVGFAIPATASKISETQKLICVTLMTFDCGTDGTCNRGAAHSIDVPLFFRVNPSAKKIVGVMSDGNKRTSDITLKNSDEDGIYLHGHQLGRSWSSSIMKDSGALTATISADNEAFIIFGRCTPDE